MKPVLKKLTPSPQTSITADKRKGRALINPWHYHPELELVCINNCPGTWLIGDKMENAPRFNVVLLGPDLPHTFHPDHKCLQKDMRGAEAIVIQFHKDFPGAHFWNLPEMHEVNNILQLSHQGLLISGSTKKKVASFMSRVLQAPPSVRVLLLLTILNEIAHSSEFSVLASRSFNYSENDKDNQKLSKIYQYTFRHFREKIFNKDAAAHFSMSTQSFCRYFKQKTGKTYLDFLIEIRIGYACKLLMENELTVSEICYCCGYSTISHFNHQFKKFMHVSPGQYRAERLTKVLLLNDQCRARATNYGKPAVIYKPASGSTKKKLAGSTKKKLK